MRALEIARTSSANKNEEWKKQMMEAQSKQLSAAEETALVEEIRNGNRILIDKLVDSQEVVILSVIKPFLCESPPDDIEEMLETGKTALQKLAEKESGSTARERFSRFGVWAIRQAILKRKQQK